MRKFVLIIVLFIFSACNTLSDAGKVMRNEKKSSTDEFLVEKRKTLVLPPDYNEIPEPGSLKKNDNAVFFGGRKLVGGGPMEYKR